MQIIFGRLQIMVSNFHITWWQKSRGATSSTSWNFCWQFYSFLAQEPDCQQDNQITVHSSSFFFLFFFSSINFRLLPWNSSINFSYLLSIKWMSRWTLQHRKITCWPSIFIFPLLEDNLKGDSFFYFLNFFNKSHAQSIIFIVFPLPKFWILHSALL